MTHDYHWPDDVYSWGQNRLGSFVPLVAQLFYKGLGLSALWSESLTHYLILLVGCLAFVSFFRSNSLKIIFAFLWFFAPIRFVDLTQLYFGVHYSLLAIACFLFWHSKAQKRGLKNLYLFFTVTALIAAVWVSDMAIISVAVLLLTQVCFYLKSNNISLETFKRLELYYALGGLLLGILFIHYCKEIAVSKYDYTQLATLEQLEGTMDILLLSLKQLLLFQNNEIPTSIYCWLLIALLLFILPQFKLSFTNPLRVFFFLEALVLLGAILSTEYTFLNNVPRRYFTCAYISLSFSFLLFIDEFQKSMKFIKSIKMLIFITVLVGGLGALYQLKYIWPGTLEPHANNIAQYEKLGESGIIAEYWNSYVSCATHPNLIKATPHDKTGSVLNVKMIDEVFKQKNIYVIKDMWLEAYPDTMEQFGRLLKKDGDEFILGGTSFCKYILK